MRCPGSMAPRAAASVDLGSEMKMTNNVIKLCIPRCTKNYGVRHLGCLRLNCGTKQRKRWQSLVGILVSVMCDSDLEAKLNYGIAMRDVNRGGDEPPAGIIDEHKFEAARRAIRFQISRDGGGNIDELCGMLYELVEARIRAFVPSENRWNDAEKTEPYWVLDYGAATVQALLKAATLWLEVPKAATSVFANLSDFNDNPHDKSHCIVDELAKRGEFKRARKVAGDILKVDPGMSEFYRNIFWAAVAECSEALGETAIALESYVKLKESDPEFYDDNEKMSLFENVSPGTLDERITRTNMNASMN